MAVLGADLAEPLAIVTGGAPRSLASDGTYLYIGDATGRVLRVRATGDDDRFEVLADELPTVRGITVANDQVYITTGDVVARLLGR